jgi:hypothetical protein
LRMVEQNTGSLETTLRLVSADIRRLQIASAGAAARDVVDEIAG